MTQNTQTTAERIFALIFENIGYTDGDDRTVAAIAAEIDALTAERDKAQAKVADWEKEEGLAEIANTQINLHYAEAAKNRELIAQLAEARAEVERLRLKAHAWDTQRHAMFLTAEQDADLLKYEWEVEDAFIVAFEAEAAERGIPPTEVSGYTDMKAEQAERIAEGIYIDGDPAKGVAK